MALVSCPNHDNISTWQLTTWHETYRLYPLVRATGKILQQWRHLYSNLLNGHAGLWRLMRRLVVTACAVLWWWVTALLTVWGVDGRWRAELVQLSIAATWHRPWPDHSAAHRCPGVLATLLCREISGSALLLCTLCCSVSDIIMIINHQFIFMMTIHLIDTCY